MVLYPLSDFTTLNFGTAGSGGSIVTGPVLNPILIVVDDDDPQLNNSDSTPPTVDSAPGGSGITPGDTLIYNAVVTNELTTAANQNFVQVTVGGTPFIAYYNAGLDLLPNTTYTEVIPAVTLTSSGYDKWGLVCFTHGTLIETEAGDTPIEELAVGDLVPTSDYRLVPIRWIGRRAFEAIDLRRNARLWPIRIRAGALADGMPRTDLTVSQQHRVLVRSKIVGRMFGTDEILVAAKKLLRLDGVEIVRWLHSVIYYHLLFDRHEVIISNGAFTESLYTGPEALKALGSEYCLEIAEIFPDILGDTYRPPYARPVPDKGSKVERLVTRQVRNAMPLYQPTV